MSRKASGYHWSLGSKCAYQGKRPALGSSALSDSGRDAQLPAGAAVAGFKVRKQSKAAFSDLRPLCHVPALAALAPSPI